MGHEGVKIAGREPVLRVMPMPADMNGNGDIFGGWLMAHMGASRLLQMAVQRLKGAGPYKHPRRKKARYRALSNVNLLYRRF
jgi:hypothetical protein